MRSRRSDVVVVGAGPAGSTLALRLARKGLAVRVVEALPFPRHKPCGEFLNPAATELLRELGLLEGLLAAGARPLVGMRVHVGAHVVRGRYCDSPERDPLARHALAMRRERLDAVLLEAALATGRVELCSGWRVRELVRDAGGRVRGVLARRAGEEQRFLARHVVGADGPHSVVAAQLGARRPGSPRERLAFVSRYAGVALDAHADAWLLADGFVAAAPIDAGDWSVGLVVERSSFERSGLDPTRFYEQRLAQVHELARRLSGARRLDPVRGRGPLALPSTRAVVDGALLVGDAAGFVDPLTGEGLYHALRGASLCAEALVACANGPLEERAALASYARRRRLELGPRSAFARLLLAGSRHPRLLRATFAALARVPPLGRAFLLALGRGFPRTRPPRGGAVLASRGPRERARSPERLA